MALDLKDILQSAASLFCRQARWFGFSTIHLVWIAVVRAVSGGTTYEIDTDCRNVRFRVGVIGKSKEQARLSNTRISDEEELEEIIVSTAGRHQLALTLEDLLELGMILVMLQAGDVRLARRHGCRC